ncbi:hypothetical protein GH733_018004, partial [Mirounga leonina]
MAMTFDPEAHEGLWFAPVLSSHWASSPGTLRSHLIGWMGSENLKEDSFSLKNIYSHFWPSLENVDPTTE